VKLYDEVEQALSAPKDTARVVPYVVLDGDDDIARCVAPLIAHCLSAQMLSPVNLQPGDVASDTSYEAAFLSAACRLVRRDDTLAVSKGWHVGIGGIWGLHGILTHDTPFSRWAKTLNFCCLPVIQVF
jgi:hypothetical protein